MFALSLDELVPLLYNRASVVGSSPSPGIMLGCCTRPLVVYACPSPPVVYAVASPMGLWRLRVPSTASLMLSTLLSLIASTLLASESPIGDDNVAAAAADDDDDDDDADAADDDDDDEEEEEEEEEEDAGIESSLAVPTSASLWIPTTPPDKGRVCSNKDITPPPLLSLLDPLPPLSLLSSLCVPPPPILLGMKG